MLMAAIAVTACSDDDIAPTQQEQQELKEGEALLQVNLSVNGSNATRTAAALDGEDYINGIGILVFDSNGDRIVYKTKFQNGKPADQQYTLKVPRGQGYKVVAIANCGVTISSILKYDDIANLKVDLEMTLYNEYGLFPDPEGVLPPAHIAPEKQSYQTTKSIPMIGETTIDVLPEKDTDITRVDLPVTRMVARVSLSQIAIDFPEFTRDNYPVQIGLGIYSSALQNATRYSSMEFDPTKQPVTSDYLSGMNYDGDIGTYWLHDTYPSTGGYSSFYEIENGIATNWMRDGGHPPYYYTFPNSSKDKPTKLVIRAQYIYQPTNTADKYYAIYYYPIVINTGEVTDKDGKVTQGDGIVRRNMVYDLKVTLKGPGNDRPDDTFDGNVEVNLTTAPWGDVINHDAEINL